MKLHELKDLFWTAKTFSASVAQCIIFNVKPTSRHSQLLLKPIAWFFPATGALY
jgi:hypothetical protein